MEQKYEKKRICLNVRVDVYEAFQAHCRDRVFTSASSAVESLMGWVLNEQAEADARAAAPSAELVEVDDESNTIPAG